MNVAVALYETRVSPRFDCAAEFLIARTQDGRLLDRTTLSARHWTGAQRVTRLVELGVDTLICGAIDMPSQRQLSLNNIELYPWITGQAQDALQCLLNGKLCSGAMTAPGGRCCGRWRFRGGRSPRRRPSR